MKKTYKYFAAAVFSGGLLFGIFAEKDQTIDTLAASPTIYTDEYNFVYYQVETINKKGEVFGYAFDGAEGLYLDNNMIGVKPGDIVRGTFSKQWDLIKAEKANDTMITLEDGSIVNAYKWFGGGEK